MAQVSMKQAVAKLAQCVGMQFDQVWEAVNTIGALSNLDPAFAEGYTGPATTVVEAMNRLKVMIPEATTDEHINQLITTSITQWVGAAPTAFDTLIEIGEYLTNNTGVVDSLLLSLAKRVRVDAEQFFTAEEKAMGRFNIDAASVLEVQQAAAAAQAAAQAYADQQLAPVSEQVDQNTDDLSVLMAGFVKPTPLQTLGISGGSTTLVPGYLASAPGAAYEAGAPAGSYVTYAIRDPDFILGTLPADTSFGKANEGKLELEVNGVKVDEFNLAAAFDANLRTAPQTYPANPAANHGAANKLTITSCGVHNTIHQRGTATVTVAAADLVKGYNTIVVKHTGIAVPETTAQFKVWYDNSGSAPVVVAPTLTLVDDGGVNAVYRSGVKYAGMGSTVELDTTVENVADLVYKLQPVTVDGMTGINSITVATTDAAVTGLSNPPVQGEDMIISAKPLVINATGKTTTNLTAGVQGSNAFVNGTKVTTAASNIMVWADDSTTNDSTESFSKEQYRLPTAYNFTAPAALTDTVTGQWDSQHVLTEGEAMVAIGATDNTTVLALPAGNFTGKYPTNTANYTGFTQAATFKRFFITPDARGNFGLEFEGLTAVDFGNWGTGKVNIKVTLPGQTATLDGWKQEAGDELVSTTGAGARAATGTNAGRFGVKISFKGKNTVSAAGRIGVEIVIRDPSIKIGSMVANFAPAY